MSLNSVLVEKKEYGLSIKKSLGILLKFKPLGLINLSDSKITNELIEGLKTLPVGFVVYIKGTKSEMISNNIVVIGEILDNELAGFDFLVCDDNIMNISKYIEKGVTPIIPENNHIASMLREFDPLKNLGNSFFYKNNNKWDIFYTIVRYIENYKFPYDNKNLVKNVINS